MLPFFSLTVSSVNFFHRRSLFVYISVFKMRMNMLPHVCLLLYWRLFMNGYQILEVCFFLSVKNRCVFFVTTNYFFLAYFNTKKSYDDGDDQTSLIQQ